MDDLAIHDWMVLLQVVVIKFSLESYSIGLIVFGVGSEYGLR